MARSSQYRRDVDGLRALAVLPVLLFHAAVPGFAGGYVGVDIFFVISGYLITSLVAKDATLGKFSLTSFYERRIRRIFPALFAAVFFSLLVAALLFSPKELTAFGKSLLAMTFFVSNILFKREAPTGGYFAATSTSQALLHTWSLSVEEQFYLFFPTAFVLLFRWAKRRTAPYLALAAVVSFAVNVWATRRHPLGAFYIFIPRAWELLLGSLLAVKAFPTLTQRVARELAGMVGLVMIVWAVVRFNDDTPFPGFAALLPCIGSLLIIYAGENGPSFVKTLLGFTPLVFIGAISYSLYLWHWPILVFAKYIFVGKLSVIEVTIALTLSVVMAFLSYEFIESPFRGADSPITRQQIFFWALVTSALSAALGFAIYVSQGFPQRFNAATSRLVSENTERQSDYLEVCSNWKTHPRRMADVSFCEIGPPSAPQIMFWGDSHVQQLYPLVQRIYDSGSLHGHGAIFAVATGCPPAEQMNRMSPGFHCDSFTHFAFMRAQQANIDTVYIGFAAFGEGWDLCPSVDGKCVSQIPKEVSSQRFLQELSWHIRKLRALKKRVIVSLPFPIFDKPIPDLQIRNAIFEELRLPPIKTVELSPPALRKQMASTAQNAGAEIFDPRSALCTNQGCITTLDGVSIYKDRSHIAASQIGILQPAMERALQSVLSAD